jgi:hypothetical protein
MTKRAIRKIYGNLSSTLRIHPKSNGYEQNACLRDLDKFMTPPSTRSRFTAEKPQK